MLQTNKYTTTNHLSYTMAYDMSLYMKWRLADVIAIVVLFVLNIIVSKFKPFERQFFINDLSISHPFAERETVNSYELLVYSTIVPFIAIVLYCILFRFKKNENRYYLLWISMVGLVLSLNITALVTNYLKNWFGRPRPDFISRCIPKDGTPKNVLVLAKDVCTTENLDRLYDGFRSCPSGHSSESFTGLGYLFYFLQGQLRVDLPQNGLYRKLISFLPLMGAALIALSRTQDYRHHFTDVFFGSFIGLIISREVYKHYFSLESESKYSALPYGADSQDGFDDNDNESYKLLDTNRRLNTTTDENINQDSGVTNMV